MKFDVGSVQVATSNNTPLGVDHWAGRIADKTISISENAPPAIREQAIAFKGKIRQVAEMYIKSAIASDRMSLAHTIELNGHKDLADIIRKL